MNCKNTYNCIKNDRLFRENSGVESGAKDRVVLD